ncbi:MAG: OmpA family protein [Desulfobacteraceae bacterium]|nr:OmpA family protein [Desulfobacteraceae bacterium]
MEKIRSRRIPKSEDPGHQHLWLTTFNDLITLLMVFFVLIFSMSSLDNHKVGEFFNAMQSALGLLEQGSQVQWGVDTVDNLKPLPTDPALEPWEPDEIDIVIESSLKELNEELGINATLTKKGATISLDDSLLFLSGKGDITGPGKQALLKIGKLLAGTDMPIRVEGHTDNVPIQTSQYPSNWELSTARAVNVLKFLVQHGNIAPERLSAVGYGAAKPMSANDTVVNRTKNRRVEIVLVMKKHN